MNSANRSLLSFLESLAWLIRLEEEDEVVTLDECHPWTLEDVDEDVEMAEDFKEGAEAVVTVAAMVAAGETIRVAVDAVQIVTTIEQCLMVSMSPMSLEVLLTLNGDNSRATLVVMSTKNVNASDKEQIILEITTNEVSVQLTLQMIQEENPLRTIPGPKEPDVPSVLAVMHIPMVVAEEASSAVVANDWDLLDAGH